MSIAGAIKRVICGILKCAVPENIHTHPMEGQWKFRGGGGLKSQNFKRKNWKFQRGGGIKIKKPSVGGVWIFSGATQYNLRNLIEMHGLLEGS